MNLCRKLLFLVIALFSIGSLHAEEHPDWTTPVTPFRIAGNLYYVGSRDLASYLIVTPAGDILINSNLQSSPPLIRHSVEQLGFHFSDIKILLISHAHSDHAGGSAAILKQTGAKYMVMDADVPLIQDGGRSDFAYGGHQLMPPAHVDRVLHDGDEVRLGGSTLVAHKTAGHTRGTTTWTMQVQDGGKTRDVVIVGGWSVLSEYRLVATAKQPASYPGIAKDYAHTFDVLRSLPCDIFLGAHGLYFGMLGKLALVPKQGPSVWIDPQGYKSAVLEEQKDFEDKLAEQRAEAGKAKP